MLVGSSHVGTLTDGISFYSCAKAEISSLTFEQSLDVIELREDGLSGRKIAEETLEEYVRQYIEAQPGPAVSFAWQGGEPTLLGIDFFRRVVEYQEKHAPPEVRVENNRQTNET